MNRRAFMLSLSAVLSAPGVASPQPPKTARVGILASSTEANFAPSVKAFRDALKDAGWIEGRNLVLDIRYGGEQYGKLDDMAAELVRLKADVIATLGTPAHAGGETSHYGHSDCDGVTCGCRKDWISAESDPSRR
jgi:putative tryptophan/tyrosine transport system substrate-binding protein